MKTLNLFVLSILACFCTFSSAFAQSPSGLANMSVPELKAELVGAKTYKALGDAQRAVDSEAYCLLHRQRALENRKALQDLKQEYAGRANEEYYRQDGLLRTAFDNSRTQFDMCFTKIANQYVTVASRKAFIAKVAAMNPKFSNKGDMTDYIAMIRAEIEARKGGANKKIGTVDSVFKDVQIRRAGQSHWTPVSKGTPVFISDHLKTGPRGRARLNFTDYIATENAGPTVVNIGSSSHIKIESFIVSFTGIKKRTGVIGLLRGTVRAFTKNWGPRSQFVIRAGATVCGIRGTEVAVSFDPTTQTATHILDHGDAYVEAGGHKVTMTPRTSITVKGTQLEWPVAISQDEWSGIVNTTGDGATIPVNPVNTANTGSIAVTDRPAAPVPELSQATPRPNTAITMKEALDTFRAYQVSAITLDQENLLSLLAEPAKSEALEIIATRGLRHYALYNSNFRNWETRCIACFNDETDGPVCIINDRRFMVDTRKQKNRYIFDYYLLRNVQGIPYISERPNFKGGRVLKKMQKKNDRVCKLDRLTIDLSNGQKQSKDGLKSLLGGLAAVLGEIQ